MTPEEVRTGFGIPVLMLNVQELTDRGIPQEAAIELVADCFELRSEAIEVLRIALKPSEGQS